ncbi:MAG: prephenate dehydrogenase [Chitinophagaceae bacterium]|nr:prephenate dehydrogenase [Chitinophagaceae bacterium]
MMNRKIIAIVGTGLIGGSLALRLHEKKLASKIIGVESDPLHAKKAMEMELVDEILPLEAAISVSDVIILSVPVDAIIQLLPLVLNRVNRQIVTDVGSTKWHAIQTVKDHPGRGRYVPAHPMWGTEYSGPEAVVKDAFENKAVVMCNKEESDEDAWQWVHDMYKKIGMHIVEMDARSHDLHAAYVSHISHITSFALANTVLQKEKEEKAIFELASAGFESTVRLAKSNPQMWAPIFLQNKNYILDVLDEHLVQLNRFREAIENENEAMLHQLISEANLIKKIIR